MRHALKSAPELFLKVLIVTGLLSRLTLIDVLARLVRCNKTVNPFKGSNLQVKRVKQFRRSAPAKTRWVFLRRIGPTR